MDCFPPGCPPAFRSYWLREAVPALKAQDRLASGAVSAEDVYDVALLATGSEDAAADLYAAKLAVLNKQRQRDD